MPPLDKGRLVWVILLQCFRVSAQGVGGHTCCYFQRSDGRACMTMVWVPCLYTSVGDDADGLGRGAAADPKRDARDSNRALFRTLTALDVKSSFGSTFSTWNWFR